MEFNIGKQIAYYRKEQGMTQEQLANRLGVTNQAVSKWETDQSCPDIQLLPQLADLFGISLDALFGRQQPAVPVVTGLPWEDDGQLRAVLYIGRKLQKQTLLKRGSQEKTLVEFRYDGPALNITSEFAVCCGDVMGSVTAGDGAACGVVYGSVTAGDGVQCGNVGGNVTAGDGITCGNIGGNAKAGDSIHCGEIGGEARASDGIFIRK